MASCKGRVCLGRENICKNCIKEDVCKIAEDFYKKPVYGMYIEDCDYFKDSNKFVELPCKVGDTVYVKTLFGDYAVSYFNTDGDNSVMGYPKSLLGFLKPNIKARF